MKSLEECTPSRGVPQNTGSGVSFVSAAVLRRYTWHDAEVRDGYSGAGKIEAIFGKGIWSEFHGKRVLDFGCGAGDETMEIARHGAADVLGIDIQESWIAIAERKLRRADLPNCRFSTAPDDTKADVILSIDSFEHFGNPAEILEQMASLLAPTGKVIVSFGPPWYHPLGGHIPLFPWAHLLLSEHEIMKWRAQFKSDGATRFSEVAGGLNQMSIRRFEQIVSQSPLRMASMTGVPIRAARKLHCTWTREFLTSIVKAVLVPR